jgi:hypothetical protein
MVLADECFFTLIIAAMTTVPINLALNLVIEQFTA